MGRAREEKRSEAKRREERESKKKSQKKKIQAREKVGKKHKEANHCVFPMACGSGVENRLAKKSLSMDWFKGTS